MRKLYFLLLLSFLHFTTNAQIDIYIGNDSVGNTGINYPAPLQDYYEGSRAQFLYRAAELHAAGMQAGLISGLKLKVINLNSFTGTIAQMSIKIGSTVDTSLDGNTWEPSVQSVYGPVDYSPVLGFNNFTFSSPFFWNGMDNIVVEICNGDPTNSGFIDYTQNVTVPWTTGLGFNGSHSYRADNAGNLCGSSTTTNSGQSSSRPDIVFQWDDSLNTNFNLIYASTFVDENNNGIKDQNEGWFENAKFITIKPGKDTINTVTSSGSAYIIIDTGAYNIRAVPYHNYYTITPASYSVNHASYHHVDTLLFAFHLIANLLHVAAYFDADADSVKDNAEPYINNVKIKMKNNYGDSVVVQSNQISTTLLLDTATYFISVENPASSYYHVTPAQYTKTFPGTSGSDSISFAVQPYPGKRDLQIVLLQYGLVRPGNSFFYNLIYKNNGTDTVTNAVVKMVKSKKFDFDNNPSPGSSIVADTITWTIPFLKPLDRGVLLVPMKVKLPPTANIGDTVMVIAKITSDKTDLTPVDNVIERRVVIRAASDPNDKTENHGGKLTTTQVSSGEYLTYTVRFQNTGNDTAFNVYIHDTLDSKLDYNTLQILTASHNYQMTMQDGKCVFRFSNILLPDSNINESASHGYLVYRIKPKPTVAIGDIIRNTAAIYFDYNLPVMTNTETTTIVADAFPLKLLSFTAKKKGKTNLLNWATAQEINVDKFEIERSNEGKEFSKIGMVKAGNSNYTFTDNNPLNATNYYRLKMVDKDGKFEYSPVRIISNNSTFSINIYPNPAKDNLQLQIDSEKPTALQLQVVSMDGKVLLSNSFSAAEGSSLRSININSLQKGNYLLKVNSGNTEESVVKFQKL